MSDDLQKDQDQEPSTDSGKQNQTAVPYIPPPPPNADALKKLRTPLTNGMIAAVAILLGGFMMYHFVGYQFTQLEGISTVNQTTPTQKNIPSPSVSPSVSPSPAVSPYPSQ